MTLTASLRRPSGLRPWGLTTTLTSADPTGNWGIGVVFRVVPFGAEMTRPLSFLHNQSVDVGAWEGCNPGWGSSRLLKWSLKGLRAGGHLLTALPDLRQQVISWRGIWMKHLRVHHNSLSEPRENHRSGSLGAPENTKLATSWSAVRPRGLLCRISVSGKSDRKQMQEVMQNIQWIERELNSMCKTRREKGKQNFKQNIWNISRL